MSETKQTEEDEWWEEFCAKAAAILEVDPDDLEVTLQPPPPC